MFSYEKYLIKLLISKTQTIKLKRNKEENTPLSLLILDKKIVFDQESPFHMVSYFRGCPEPGIGGATAQQYMSFLINNKRINFSRLNFKTK